MGSGIDAARSVAPEHAALMENFRDQLLIALVRRAAGGKVSIPVSEVDDTGGVVLLLSVTDRTFHLEVRKKQ